jgi:uncharacterized protein with PQ loop repeat
MKPLTDNQDVIRGVAIFGIVATQIMNLSSIPSMIDIIKAKSTLSYPTFPFSVSIVASTTSIIYSVLSDQIIVGLSSMMTVGQCVIYESIHFYYSHHRRRIVLELVALSVIVAGVLGTGIFFKCVFSNRDECSAFVTYWFGLIMAIISCFRYGAQAYTVGSVIRKKNAASISPSMTMGAMFASLAWTVYSLLAGDPYYLASGLAGVASCFLQIILLLKYPRIFSRSPPPEVSKTTSEVSHELATIGRTDEGTDLRPT